MAGPPLQRFWLDSTDEANPSVAIDREYIIYNIYKATGVDSSTVETIFHEPPYSDYIRGYYYEARRPLTAAQIKTLREESVEYVQRRDHPPQRREYRGEPRREQRPTGRGRPEPRGRREDYPPNHPYGTPGSSNYGRPIEPVYEPGLAYPARPQVGQDLPDPLHYPVANRAPYGPPQPFGYDSPNAYPEPAGHRNDVLPPIAPGPPHYVYGGGRNDAPVAVPRGGAQEPANEDGSSSQYPAKESSTQYLHPSGRN